MNEWMKSPIGWKTREKKRKAKARSWTSRPFPNLAKLPSSEARYREREREMCGSDGTPTATVTANSRGAPLRFGDGELGWALTLSALQKISYSFLTSNLLTYLPTKSPPLPWGDGGPTVVTPPPPSPPPPPSFCARDLFDFCCAVSWPRRRIKQSRERTSLATKALTELSDGRKTRSPDSTWPAGCCGFKESD